jgi:hypothetical protein
MRDGSKQMFDANNPFVTCLDHDHRERENIGFFAVCPLLVQNLWRGPLPGVTPITQGTPDGIQVLSDPGKPKVGDSCVVGGIQKNI